MAAAVVGGRPAPSSSGTLGHGSRGGAAAAGQRWRRRRPRWARRHPRWAARWRWRWWRRRWPRGHPRWARRPPRRRQALTSRARSRRAGSGSTCRARRPDTAFGRRRTGRELLERRRRPARDATAGRRATDSLGRRVRANVVGGRAVRFRARQPVRRRTPTGLTGRLCRRPMLLPRRRALDEVAPRRRAARRRSRPCGRPDDVRRRAVRSRARPGCTSRAEVGGLGLNPKSSRRSTTGVRRRRDESRPVRPDGSGMRGPRSRVGYAAGEVPRPHRRALVQLFSEPAGPADVAGRRRWPSRTVGMMSVSQPRRVDHVGREVLIICRTDPEAGQAARSQRSCRSSTTPPARGGRWCGRR